MIMATSSIFYNIKISDEKAAEAFVNALEESEKAQANKLSAEAISVLKDLDEIRKLVAKWKAAK